MGMIFGLDFKNDSGERVQFAVNTENEEVRIRVTQNGQWRPWQRIDVKRKPGGEIDETVWQAKQAETADRFTTPIRLYLSGAVSGSAQFDGATENIGMHVSMGQAIHAAIAAAMQAHVDQYHSSTGNDGGGFVYDGGGG